MIYPKKALAQLIVHSCETHGIKTVIITPGSRNAPLIIGFHNNPNIKSLRIVDERSAAFFALGIAQQTQQPVALVCTSGSALLNYYPAIAEAYYSNIPLVVISADRPDHLLGIGDGQTINQKNVFHNHILDAIHLVDDCSDNFELLHAILQKSIDYKGPIHINVPFDEPLYETSATPLNFPLLKTPNPSTLLDETPLDVDYLTTFANQWHLADKKMVLIGVHFPSELLQIQINHLLKDPSVLVLTETPSNIYHTKIINGIDKLIAPLTAHEKKALQPDILLTFGGMVVSKKIKQFLREFTPQHHWHIDKKNALNTYHCLSKHFKISIELFFSQFFFLTTPKDSTYQNQFLSIQQKHTLKHHAYLKTAAFSDLKVFDTVLNTIPKNYTLQLANSSIIRYTQLFDINKSIQVFCNRGTSGIDGSTSTAIGSAYASSRKTLFITGDISFYYDSNAFWHTYISKNLRIIIINNSGGGIFRFIPGPQTTNALDYFETPHQLNASHLCKMHGVEYHKATNLEELHHQLQTFYTENTRAKVLEIFTPKTLNDKILKDYFKNLT